MPHSAPQLLSDLTHVVIAAIATHLVMSLSQTLMRYKPGPTPWEAIFIATTSTSTTLTVPETIWSRGITFYWLRVLLVFGFDRKLPNCGVLRWVAASSDQTGQDKLFDRARVNFVQYT